MNNTFSQDGKNDASQGGGAMDQLSSPQLRTRFRLNLRVKLPLVVISLLFLSFLGVTILSVNISRKTLTETLTNNLATEAVLQAESIRSHLTWTRSMAIDLGTVAEAIDLDKETSKAAIAQMLSKNEQVVGSTIAYEPYRFDAENKYWAPYYSRNVDGSLQFSQLGTPEYNYPIQDWYKRAKDANGIILSPPYFDAGGGNIWMVTWSVPFYSDSGQLSGIATTDIAFSQTQEIVQRIVVGKRGYAFLIDQNGAILGIGEQGGQYKIMEDSLLFPDSSEDSTAWSELIAEMINGKAGFKDLVDPQGNAMFVAYEPIGMDTGWSLGLAYPQEELFQPALQLQNNLISLSLIVLVIASIALFFFSQSITRPLQKITTWAASIAQRQNDPDVNQIVEPLHIHTNDEIEDLAETFNQMSDELSQAFSTLEKRVQERTTALSSVAEVSTAASTILETDKLLQQVVDLAKERFSFYHAHIYLLDATGTSLVLSSGAGAIGQQMVAKGHSIPLDREQSLVARAAREKKGVTVNDVTTEPNFLPNPLLPDTHSELAVPLMVGDKLLGVFDVQSDVVGRFTESDIAVQTTLASQVASAVQNTRLYSETLEAQKLTRSVIDSTDDWIFIKDQEHRYQLVNQGYANSLHIPIADFIGRNDLELGFPEELVKGNPEKGIRGFWADDRSVMDGGVPKQIPDDFVTIDGKIRVFDTVKVPLRDADNKVWGVLAFARDMTERRRLEELNRKRASQQEAINTITQRIQSATSVESALQIAARELGHALGQRQTLVSIEPAALSGNGSDKSSKESV